MPRLHPQLLRHPLLLDAAEPAQRRQVVPEVARARRVLAEAEPLEELGDVVGVGRRAGRLPRRRQPHQRDALQPHQRHQRAVRAHLHLEHLVRHGERAAEVRLAQPEREQVLHDELLLLGRRLEPEVVGDVEARVEQLRLQQPR